MKKLTAASLAIAGALLFALTGCSADTFTEKSYTAEGAVTEIVIDVEDREVTVAASEDEFIHIDYFDGKKEYLDIALSDGRLTVKLVYDKEWTDYIGVKPAAEYRRIEVRIPDDTVVSFWRRPPTRTSRFPRSPFPKACASIPTAGISPLNG